MKAPKPRNPIAAVLGHVSFAPRKVRARKGKGSYRRNVKHKGRHV